MESRRKVVIAAIAGSFLLGCLSCRQGAREAAVSEVAPGGIEVSIGANGREVVIMGDDGRVLNTVDVFDACGDPSVGAPMVRDFEIVGTRVDVVYGKHSHASIDGLTGEVECEGSD